MDLQDFALSFEEKSKIESLFKDYGALKHDPWGASLESILVIAPVVKFLFEKYFRVSLSGTENIPEGNAIFIANHGGQVPIDALMLVYSLLVKTPHSRLTRGMVERWVPTLPFIGSFFMKMGQIVGDQQNCLKLLDHQQSVLVFPEGVKGSGKTIDLAYQLQSFGTGFYRLAIESKVPIVPVTLIGTEETYPSVANLKVLAKLLNAPYFPITPFFPLLGPLGAIPIPSKISIHFHKPVNPSLPLNASEEEVKIEIEKVRSLMQKSLNEGLEKRGTKFFSANAFESKE